MLDPAGLRVNLPEFALGAADDIAVMVEEDGSGRRRALIERQDVFCHVRSSPLLSGQFFPTL